MKKKPKPEQKTSTFYPPVVAVLGHVDHGKTSLLDAIRKSSIAEREHGGITQSIGASSIEVIHDGIKRSITFIDTPGHQTFSKMRSRGAQVADIVLLIVSSTDGVQPQTKESIELLKSSKIPFIVVFTKSDLEGKNTEKLKGELTKEGVTLEGLGGDVPFLEVSAKTGSNIKELLDLILLVYELQGYKAKGEEFSGIIIESRLDPKAGPKATVIVRSGKILLKDTVFCEDVSAKVRTLIDPAGNQVQSAAVGQAVEVFGFEKVPPVGAEVSAKEGSRQVEQTVPKTPATAEDWFAKADQSHLSVVICADTQGSLEAIGASLPKEITIALQKTGDVTASDIAFAKSTGSIVIGFNIKIGPAVTNLARTERVLTKNYTIIYELLDELSDVVAGKLEALQEEILGVAKILASFPFEKTKVLGVRVEDGRIARGDKVRLMRGEEAVGESTITSVRRGKETTSKVEKGSEAGIILSPSLDFTIGDMVLSHN